MKSIYRMFVANLKEYVRDISGVFWTFAFPFVFIILFGLIFTGDGQDFGFDYILPGIMGMALMQSGLFGALQFLNLREKKIIRGLSLTPIPRSSLLSSEILLRLITGFLQAAIMILLGIFVFNVELTGRLYQVIPLVFLGSLTFVSIGYLLTCFVKSVEGGTGLAQIVQLPMMFLSGVFFPVDMLPGFLRPAVRIIPLTYLVDSLRHVMVGIPGDYSLFVNSLVLIFFLLITFVISIKLWRWE